MNKTAPSNQNTGLNSRSNKTEKVTYSELKELVKKHKLPLSSHSGAVSKGGVFLVLPAPVTQDKIFSEPGGEIYLEAAAKKEPLYFLVEKRHYEEAMKYAGDKIKIVTCPSTRIALGDLAKAYFDTDEKCPELIAVTGTNGKTTESYLLECLFENSGQKTGIIGTVEYRWPGHHESSALTTPGCLELHEIMSLMAEAGTEKCIMEVSSHAIDQERVAGLNFSASLITNLTQDHLDYHANMQDYFNTKSKLFLNTDKKGLPYNNKVGAVNTDDPWCRKLLEKNKNLVGFGLESKAVKAVRHLSGKILAMSPEGMRLALNFEGRKWELSSPLVGAFNAMNLLGAQALALAMGMKEDSFMALESFGGVPGRMERIINRKNLGFFVDYAHTPDALRKALQALKQAGFSRIVTVFGCGGNRDKTKRPLMGKAVSELSDIAVLTSDNPRKEDPEAIMDDVMPGLTGCKEVYREISRRKAIEKAVSLMHPGDALLVAGKGHENYQIIGTEKRVFSDQTVLRELSL